MVRCVPVDEPADFHGDVRQRGLEWLRRHGASGSRPPAYWRRFNAELAAAFHERCAYTAMFLSSPGTVDHFVSIEENRSLAYEWSNYRYSAGWINSSKQSLASGGLLDPFLVRPGWFELHLPSLQLSVSSRCPRQYRRQAENTLIKLGLRDDERVIRYRRKWLEEYEKREITLDYLEQKAPLVALAVRRWEAENGRRWRPVNSPPQRQVTRRRRAR
ncbi:hypothetical protein [Hyalangium versicolor]|uniref:hypothetical protein n=1 Tax=Hyalangium versicolor TaxID=2861190 RepID=UPI001CCA11E5|nr:hypothetical protein [Hyalangium versicolor]